jgi:hypothetical protein
MRKQKIDRLKNMLAILLIVLFVLSLTATAIDARSHHNNMGLKSATKTTVIGENATATKTTLVGSNTTAARTVVAGKNATATKTIITGKNATATKVNLTKAV